MSQSKTPSYQRRPFIIAGSVFTLLLSIGLFVPLQAQAIQIALEVPFGKVAVVGGLADYVANIYTFIIASIGIVATVMIMVHGIQWSLAAGNSDIVSRSKQGIINAVVGVVLAFLSYVILYTINPALVTFAEPAIPTVFVYEDEDVDKALSDVDIDCAAFGLEDFQKQLIDIDANAKRVITFEGKSSPCITSHGLASLKRAVQYLNDSNNSGYGMRLAISSAYRSREQQQELWDCFQAGRCNVAAKPGTSRHETGNALDVRWEPIAGTAMFVSNKGYAKSTWHDDCLAAWVPGQDPPTGCDRSIINSIIGLQAVMQASGFSRICNEWWHFQMGGTNTCAAGEFKKATGD